MRSEELHLWRTVLVLGLLDTARGEDPDWLQTKDFEFVCELANMNPDRVRAVFTVERFSKRIRIHDAA